MENTNNNKRKNLIVSAVILAVLHIVYSAMDYAYIYMSGDYTKEILLTVMFYVMNAVNVLIVFFRFGVAICAYRCYGSKKAFSFAVVCGISFFASHFLELLVFAVAYSQFSENAMAYILSTLLSFLADLVILSLVILLSQLKPIAKARLWVSAVIASGLYLMTVYIQAVFYTDFSNIEVNAILLDYLRPFICAALGVFVILLTDALLFDEKEKI